MSFINEKVQPEGLTFDDVLLVPAYSEVLPREVSVVTRFSRNIQLNIPIVSAAMDTVTEAPLAIALAREGGIGVIHKNMSIAEQAAHVRKVKRAENGMIYDPITISKDDTVGDALALMKENKIGGIPVVAPDQHLIGIVTNRDLRFQRDMNRKIDETGLDATTRYELHTRLASMHVHKKVCHGDFNPSNIIIAPDGQWYILDWSHATQGNASADVARTYLLFVLEGKEALAEKYLSLFCKKSDTAKQYVQKWIPIVAASQSVKGKPEEKEFLLRWADVVDYE